MRLRDMLAAGLLAAALCGPAAAGDVHSLAGVSFEAPDRWAEFTRIEDLELGFVRPDSLGRLSVYWWLPDEPLLGAPDILSHETISVAGRPALLVHYDFYSEESLKAVLLEPRDDGRQLVLAVDFPKGETGAHDALLRDVLASIRFDGEADAPSVTAADQDEGTPAMPPQQAGLAASPDVDRQWLAGRFGQDCSMVELGTWRHPVRAVIEQAGANRLLWLALCQDRTYPVFGMEFDYDPRGATRDYFVPLWMDMLEANGRWAFSVAIPRDNVMVNVSRDGSGVMLDEEELDFAAPAGETMQPDGNDAQPESAPGISFTDEPPAATARDTQPSAGMDSGGSPLAGTDPEDLPPVSGSGAPSATPRNGMEAVMRDLNNYLKD